MVRDAVTGLLLDYGPQAKFMARLRPCFVKFLFSLFFFPLGKQDVEDPKLVFSLLKLSICRELQMFPKYLSLLGVTVCQLFLNLLDAHQNYLGTLLKIQILGPHPRRL